MKEEIELLYGKEYLTGEEQMFMKFMSKYIISDKGRKRKRLQDDMQSIILDQETYINEQRETIREMQIQLRHKDFMINQLKIENTQEEVIEKEQHAIVDETNQTKENIYNEKYVNELLNIIEEQQIKRKKAEELERQHKQEYQKQQERMIEQYKQFQKEMEVQKNKHREQLEVIWQAKLQEEKEQQHVILSKQLSEKNRTIEKLQNELTQLKEQASERVVDIKKEHGREDINTYFTKELKQLENLRTTNKRLNEKILDLSTFKREHLELKTEYREAEIRLNTMANINDQLSKENIELKYKLNWTDFFESTETPLMIIQRMQELKIQISKLEIALRKKEGELLRMEQQVEEQQVEHKHQATLKIEDDEDDHAEEELMIAETPQIKPIKTPKGYYYPVKTPGFEGKPEDVPIETPGVPGNDEMVDDDDL
mmetsp:Transcript_12934/g.19493  ORF Transcript_12934/g.19493 Transcript_12934/m.19493 type:complete len:427 (+) Transcript_12934:42-1322(+)